MNTRSPHSGCTDRLAHRTGQTTNNNCASVVCTFGAALWRFKMYTSLRNVHPQPKKGTHIDLWPWFSNLT